MSRQPAGKPPALRRHVRGHGTVRLSGHDHYLGAWPDPHSPAPAAVTARYHELVARWLAGGRKPLPTNPARDGPLLVGDLLDRFLSWARGDYPAGSREPAQYALAFGPVRKLYGLSPAAEFRPPALKAVRAEMLARGWCRSHVNRSVNRVRRAWKWGASEDLVPAAVYDALRTVEGLRKGQQGSGEAPARLPATEDELGRVCAVAVPAVAAMLRLLWLTGMRPGEVRKLRADELERAGDVWVYRPAAHKTAWKGQGRAVAVGPRAQEVLRPWLDRHPEGFLFRPADAPKACARRSVNGCYPRDGFAQAVRRAAERAGLPGWHAYRTRHAAKMRVEKEAGAEAARAVLGQRHIATLSHYGTQDVELAKDVMRKIG